MAKVRPQQQHSAFFIAPILFSEKHLTEFTRRGFSDEVVRALARNLSDLASWYATNAPSPREEKRRLRAIGNAFNDCGDAMLLLDDWTVSTLDMRARPLGTDMNFRDLRKEIEVFREAARIAVEKIHAPESGPEATKDTAIAVNIGKTLRCFEIPLDDRASGKFVIATGIIFEALGIAKANPRMDARRALEIIEKSH